jgi:predicted short-subunit dehydrogenase-like oxidoreductase (DUF2520 family)
MNIGIIGAGKVGTALGYTLKKKGYSITAVASRRERSLEIAKRYIGAGPVYTTDNKRVLATSDVVAVTTQDREIKNVAEELFQFDGPLDGITVFHTSGAHPSSELFPLSEKGACLGSLHPLQTFPDIEAGITGLPGTYIFVEGDEAALPVLKTIATAVGAKSILIEKENKVLYHLAAVFVCNLLTALLHVGEGITGKIGIDLKPFYPIIRSTMKNIEVRGPLFSLTGPIVRGDAGTVESHLAAMEGAEPCDSVYRSLSLVALGMAEERKTLTDGQVAAIRRLLTQKQR